MRNRRKWCCFLQYIPRCSKRAREKEREGLERVMSDFFFLVHITTDFNADEFERNLFVPHFSINPFHSLLSFFFSFILNILWVCYACYTMPKFYFLFLLLTFAPTAIYLSFNFVHFSNVPFLSRDFFSFFCSIW